MKKIGIASLIFMGLSSCGIYRQNVVNTPLFQHKGQVQIGGYIGLNGFDFQGAYALTDKIALIGNYNTLTLKPQGSYTYFSPTNYSIDKHDFTEIGIGYYSKNSMGNSNELYFLGGYGMTSRYNTGGDTIKGHTAPYEYFRKANYTRFVVQADFGKKAGEFEFAFTPRIFYLHYFNVEDTPTSRYIDLSSNYFYTEALFTIRCAVFKYLKISAQIGTILPLSSSTPDYYEFFPICMNVGLILNLK